MHRYGKLVYGIATRSGLGTEDANDLVQSVFLIIWRNLSLLDAPAALGGWIVTIAKRETWRSVHRQRRGHERERQLHEIDGPAGPIRPDASLENAERAYLLERGLRRLDERCRRLLTLLFYENPTPDYAEISRRLGMSVGSLGPTRGRCLEKLRRELEALGW